MNRQVRVVTLNGDPWFVANDVCRALDFTMMTNGHPNVTRAIRHLEGDEKGFTFIKTLGGSQRVRIITRSGLNKLIMRSNKPVAKKFQDWLAREVIPAIQDGDVKAIMRVMESANGVGVVGCLDNPAAKKSRANQWRVSLEISVPQTRIFNI